MPPKRGGRAPPAMSPFQAALSGLSSGISEDEWVELCRPFRSLNIYAIPSALHHLTLNDNVPNQFLQHANAVWTVQDQKDQVNQTDEERVKFVRVEWFCLKRFLFERMQKMREVTYDLARLVETPDMVDTGRLIHLGGKWLNEAIDFESNIVEGSWVGSLLKEYAGPSLGSSNITFLVWILHPQLRLRLLVFLKHLIRWDRVPTLDKQPPEDVSTNIRQSEEVSRHPEEFSTNPRQPEDDTTSIRQDSIDIETIIRACASGNSLFATKVLRHYYSIPTRKVFEPHEVRFFLPVSDRRRMIIGPQGDIHATYLRRLRAVVITPYTLGTEKDPDGQISVDVHDGVCDTVIDSLKADPILTAPARQPLTRLDLPKPGVQFKYCVLPRSEPGPLLISASTGHQAYDGTFGNQSHLGRVCLTLDKTAELLNTLRHLRNLKDALGMLMNN